MLTTLAAVGYLNQFVIIQHPLVTSTFVDLDYFNHYYINTFLNTSTNIGYIKDYRLHQPFSATSVTAGSTV